MTGCNWCDESVPVVGCTRAVPLTDGRVVPLCGFCLTAAEAADSKLVADDYPADWTLDS